MIDYPDFFFRLVRPRDVANRLKDVLNHPSTIAAVGQEDPQMLVEHVRDNHPDPVLREAARKLFPHPGDSVTAGFDFGRAETPRIAIPFSNGVFEFHVNPAALDPDRGSVQWVNYYREMVSDCSTPYQGCGYASEGNLKMRARWHAPPLPLFHFHVPLLPFTVNTIPQSISLYVRRHMPQVSILLRSLGMALQLLVGTPIWQYLRLSDNAIHLKRTCKYEDPIVPSSSSPSHHSLSTDCKHSTLFAMSGNERPKRGAAGKAAIAVKATLSPPKRRNTRGRQKKTIAANVPAGSTTITASISIQGAGDEDGEPDDARSSPFSSVPASPVLGAQMGAPDAIPPPPLIFTHPPTPHMSLTPRDDLNAAVPSNPDAETLFVPSSSGRSQSRTRPPHVKGPEAPRVTPIPLPPTSGPDTSSLELMALREPPAPPTIENKPPPPLHAAPPANETPVAGHTPGETGVAQADPAAEDNAPEGDELDPFLDTPQDKNKRPLPFTPANTRPSSSMDGTPTPQGRVPNSVREVEKEVKRRVLDALDWGADQTGYVKDYFWRSVLKEYQGAKAAAEPKDWNIFQNFDKNERQSRGDTRVYSAQEVSARFALFKEQNPEWKEILQDFEELKQLDQAAGTTLASQQRLLKKLHGVMVGHVENAFKNHFEVLFVITCSSIFQNYGLSRMYTTKGLKDFCQTRLGITDDKFLGLALTEACHAAANTVTQEVLDHTATNKTTPTPQPANNDVKPTPQPANNDVKPTPQPSANTSSRRAAVTKPPPSLADKQNELLRKQYDDLVKKFGSAPRSTPAPSSSATAQPPAQSRTTKSTTWSGGQQTSSTRTSAQIFEANEAEVVRPPPPHPNSVQVPSGASIPIPIPPYIPLVGVTKKRNVDDWCKSLMDSLLLSGRFVTEAPNKTAWEPLPRYLEKSGLCLVGWPVGCPIPGEADILNPGPSIGIRAIGQGGKQKLIDMLTAPDAVAPKYVRGDPHAMSAKLMPIVIEAAPVWTPSQVQLFKQLRGKKLPQDSEDVIPPERGRRLFANGAYDNLGPRYVVSTTRPDYLPIFDYSDKDTATKEKTAKEPSRQASTPATDSPPLPIDPALDSKSVFGNESTTPSNDDVDDDDSVEVSEIPLDLRRRLPTFRSSSPKKSSSADATGSSASESTSSLRTHSRDPSSHSSHAASIPSLPQAPPSAHPTGRGAPGPPGRGAGFGHGRPGRGRGAPPGPRGRGRAPAVPHPSVQAQGPAYPVYHQPPYGAHPPYGAAYYYPPAEGSYHADPYSDGNFSQHPPFASGYQAYYPAPAPTSHEAAYDDEYDDMYVDDPPAGPSGSA
ncbi:hypothetical protein MD484_g7874, partial [Candolleomyces efflorescens]